MTRPVVRTLFVCMGNICRSPMAEGVFRELVAKAGLTSLIATDSAGTIRFHAGKPPDDRARAAAANRGVAIADLRARQVEPDDYGRFDYLLAMDCENLGYLEDGCPARYWQRVRLLLDYVPEFLDRDVEVPDPYYGGPDGFERALDLIEQGATGLLAHIRSEHGL